MHAEYKQNTAVMQFNISRCKFRLLIYSFSVKYYVVRGVKYIRSIPRLYYVNRNSSKKIRFIPANMQLYKKVAIYCRVSTMHESQDESLEIQTKILKQVVETNLWLCNLDGAVVEPLPYLMYLKKNFSGYQRMNIFPAKKLFF